MTHMLKATPEYIVAKALDDHYDEWCPEGGLEDLMLVSAAHVLAVPTGLKRIANIAIAALREAGVLHEGDEA